MDLLSKKTRTEFQEYLTTITLREIERYFDNHDIAFIQMPAEKLPSGQRRALVVQYYASVDWANAKNVNSVLSAYSDILSDLGNNDTSWGADERKTWLEKLSKCLLRDGFQFAHGKISPVGHIVDFEDLANATNVLDKTHFQEYIDRIKKSVNDDPGLAIGSTKELVESTLTTILSELKLPYEKDDDIPKLLRKVQKALHLVPDEVDESKKGADIIRVLLSNIGQIVVKTAELRNLYGTGHGKERKRKGLSERHARLVVGSGVALATFLLETFELQNTFD